MSAIDGKQTRLALETVSPNGDSLCQKADIALMSQFVRADLINVELQCPLFCCFSAESGRLAASAYHAFLPNSGHLGASTFDTKLSKVLMPSPAAGNCTNYSPELRGRGFVPSMFYRPPVAGEGICPDSLLIQWQEKSLNSARVTWMPPSKS